MYCFFWIVKAIKRILRNVNPNNTSPFHCSSHPCKYGLYAQATVRDCHEMSGDLDSSASFELRPRIDLALMLGPPLRREVEFSHMTKDFFEWQYTRPRIVPYGTSPYGHTPRNSRCGKPFLPSIQCIGELVGGVWGNSGTGFCREGTQEWRKRFLAVLSYLLSKVWILRIILTKS